MYTNIICSKNTNSNSHPSPHAGQTSGLVNHTQTHNNMNKGSKILNLET
jgi:hypothetical protein